MKILFVSNKTYRGKIDSSYYNFYMPLISLGHEVELFDTSTTAGKPFDTVVESFKPDLIFCCLTGDRNITPNEPWEELFQETQSGRTKTFNWFCDDTWRFARFSSRACRTFLGCSTPEPSFVEKYQSIGYNNIIVGNWHVNHRMLLEQQNKTSDITFVGFQTGDRKKFFKEAREKGVDVNLVYGVSSEEMNKSISSSRIGINLSRNDNDPFRKTQMKLRMFEIPANNSLLLTEHHNDLDQFYEIDKEIITFKSVNEFVSKSKFLLERPKLIRSITSNGHKRFMNEHTSEKRLDKILKWIQSI